MCERFMSTMFLIISNVVMFLPHDNTVSGLLSTWRWVSSGFARWLSPSGNMLITLSWIVYWCKWVSEYVCMVPCKRIGITCRVHSLYNTYISLKVHYVGFWGSLLKDTKYILPNNTFMHTYEVGYRHLTTMYCIF